jgi:LmbE family N-acetylglucosaminyl deacetylase
VITIVEPHSDDAWLSMGQHLLQMRERGQEVTIVTVYGNAKRLREARDYATYIGARHHAIGIPENDLGANESYETELPRGLLDGIDGIVIGPLGLQHPEHRAVARALPIGVLRYVDLPYSRKQVLAPEVTRVLTGHEVVSWLPRSAMANAPAAIFKSQSQFWRFNREVMVGAVEVLVRAGAQRTAQDTIELDRMLTPSPQ